MYPSERVRHVAMRAVAGSEPRATASGSHWRRDTPVVECARFLPRSGFVQRTGRECSSLPLAVLKLEAAGSNSSRMNATIAVLTTPSRPTDGHESGRSESATICVHLWTVLLHRQLPRLVRIERVEGGRELSGLRAQVLLEDPSVGSDHERHDARRAPAHRVGDDRESAD